MGEKRLKRIRCTREWSTLLLRGDVGIVAGVPDDAYVSNMYHDGSRQEMVLIIYSEEFDVVHEGEEIPVLQAVSVNVNFDDPIA